MKEIRFEWNSIKAEKNVLKHKISFAEAMTVFSDESAIEFYDDEHSEWEGPIFIIGNQ